VSQPAVLELLECAVGIAAVHALRERASDGDAARDLEPLAVAGRIFSTSW
jgi:hypothetical protein